MQYFTRPNTPLARYECERIAASIKGHYTTVIIVPAFTEHGVEFCHVKVN